MGRLSRSESCPDNEISVCHCINRCVRRGFLCGKDEVSGKNFEHRREWIRGRFEFLAGEMAVEVLGYAILSNHFHVILRNRPDVVTDWSDDEVALRWWNLCPGRRNKDKTPAKPTELELNAIKGDKEKLKEYRKRLSSVSWFMRFAAEHIAKRANEEDECTGRFFEGRFKCQPLLDDAAILACMQYVDLNPIRAKIASTVEGSDFTSGQDRLADLKAADGDNGGSSSGVQVSGNAVAVSLNRDAVDRQVEHGPNAGWLQPVDLAPPRKRVREKGTSRRASNKGFLSMTLAEYLQLLDWTGRQIRRDAKSGTIPSNLQPILERVGVSSELWVECVKHFGKWHGSGVGRPASLNKQAERTGRNRSLNTGRSRELFG
jgi:hypothetical protein